MRPLSPTRTSPVQTSRTTAPQPRTGNFPYDDEAPTRRPRTKQRAPTSRLTKESPPMRLVRDLGRRKLRSTLTITGIAIGIMALVVFGSMANKMNALIGGGSKYYADKITVTVGSMYSGSIQPLSLSDVDKIRNVEGVAAATPTIDMMLSDEGGATMGTPEMISGGIPGGDKGLETFKIDLAQGRELTAADATSKVTVLGSDLARKLNANTGDTVTLRGAKFTVVGVWAPTLTAPDKDAYVPMAAAQELFVKSLPPIIQSKVNASEIATGVVVYPAKGVDPETIKTRLKDLLGSSYTVMTGKDFDAMLGSLSAIFTLVLTGVAMLSLLRSEEHTSELQSRQYL